MRSRAKVLRLLLVPALLAALCSCMADTKSLTFATIGQKGWSHTDTLSYVIPPLKGMGDCGVALLLRTEGYGYENIALDIDIRQDGTQLYHQQRHYWLSEEVSANGIGRRCDYTLPVGNLTLCDTLPTTITVVHNMEQPLLKGIREVGVRTGRYVHESDTVIWQVDWR